MIDRAVDAEFLGLTQEEYIILTHEAFWPKRYFDLTQNTPSASTTTSRRSASGRSGNITATSGPPEADMLSLDEDPKTGQKGLTFVKKQFLPRTGIQYTDLVELLKTRFINPNFPQGQGPDDSGKHPVQLPIPPDALVDTSDNDRKPASPS